MLPNADCESRLHALVAGICATEQHDVMAAVEGALQSLLNGAMALKHLRMYPEFAAEAVKSTVLHTGSLKLKEPGSNV